MRGVEIEKGIFKSGILSDKCLGQNPNSIISYLDNYFSNDTSVKFVNNYQMAMNMVVTELGIICWIGRLSRCNQIMNLNLK